MGKTDAIDLENLSLSDLLKRIDIKSIRLIWGIVVSMCVFSFSAGVFYTGKSEDKLYHLAEGFFNLGQASIYACAKDCGNLSVDAYGKAAKAFETYGKLNLKEFYEKKSHITGTEGTQARDETRVVFANLKGTLK